MTTTYYVIRAVVRVCFMALTVTAATIGTLAAVFTAALILARIMP